MYCTAPLPPNHHTPPSLALTYKSHHKSIAQTTPDPSGRRTPSRRRLVTKFGSVPTSSSPRTFWWRNIAALATGRRCSRPFLTVFRENLNKPADRETAATTPPRLCRRAPGRLTQPLGTRGRPLTEFGQPPPASSLAAPGTPATSLAACCVARFWAVSPRENFEFGGRKYYRSRVTLPKVP